MSVWEGTTKQGLFRVQQQTPSQLEIHVTLSAKHLDQCIAHEYRQLAARTKLPGFRKGKVPVALLRARQAGSLESNVARKQVELVYAQAVQQAGVSPVQDAQLQQSIQYVADQDLSCVLHVQVRPQLQLAQWQGLQVRVPEFVVDQKHLDNAMQQLQLRYSVLAPIAPRETIATGDVAYCHMQAQAEGKPVAALQQENAEFVVGEESSLPQIHQALLNRKIGEEFELKVKLPETFIDAAMRGQEVTIHLKVNDVKQRKLPQLDDEFAKDVLAEDSTLKQLQEQVELSLQQQKRDLQQQRCQDATIEALLQLHDVELPEALVEDYCHRLWRQAAAGLNMQPNVLQQTADESMKKQLQQQARYLVKKELVLEAIAKQTQVEVPDEELKQEVTKLAAQMPAKQAENFVKRLDVYALREAMKREKALQLVVKQAKVDRFEEPLPMASQLEQEDA